MGTFKVQKIRACTQCGVVLSLRCKSCIKHPDRKPTTVEYFNWPPILEICPCKCSVRVQCQRPGCAKTMWRNKSHNNGGLSRSSSLFCSPQCNCMVRSAERDTRVLVACGWSECKNKTRRRSADLKVFHSVYCCQSHYFLARKKETYEKRHAEQVEDETLLGLMYCEKCKDVQEHETPPLGQATCKVCRSKKDQDTSSLKSNALGGLRR
jgi:hypothetical protein